MAEEAALAQEAPFEELSSDDFVPYFDWLDRVEELRAEKRAWRFEALCGTKKGPSVKSMYPSATVRQQEMADKTCAFCPVRRECLQFALITKEIDGVWGGATQEQRKGLLSEVAAEEPNWRKWWRSEFNDLFDLVIDEFLTEDGDDDVECDSSSGSDR